MSPNNNPDKRSSLSKCYQSYIFFRFMFKCVLGRLWSVDHRRSAEISQLLVQLSKNITNLYHIRPANDELITILMRRK